MLRERAQTRLREELAGERELTSGERVALQQVADAGPATVAADDIVVHTGDLSAYSGDTRAVIESFVLDAEARGELVALIAKHGASAELPELAEELGFETLGAVAGRGAIDWGTVVEHFRRAPEPTAKKPATNGKAPRAEAQQSAQAQPEPEPQNVTGEPMSPAAPPPTPARDPTLPAVRVYLKSVIPVGKGQDTMFDLRVDQYTETPMGVRMQLQLRRLDGLPLPKFKHVFVPWPNVNHVEVLDENGDPV